MTTGRTRILALGLVALAGCGANPTGPQATPDAPTLSCPASVNISSPVGAAMPFSFAVPTPIGGQSPVVVSCSKLSGTPFPLGSTIVTCTTTDGLGRSASCNFSVTVTAIPRISKTSFLAFGDSITEGRCGPKPNTCPPWTVRFAELLRERYSEQTFTVTNRGISGEKATTGEGRLLGELLAYNPEVLLLMEGTNDLTALHPAEGLNSLEKMVDIAQGRHITVFLATVAPIVPGGPNNSAVPLVVSFNDHIRALAARKNIPLVDVFTALNADISRYYAGDDLHPTGDGLRLIGETFYATVRIALDITPGGGLFKRQSGIWNR